MAWIGFGFLLHEDLHDLHAGMSLFGHVAPITDPSFVNLFLMR